MRKFTLFGGLALLFLTGVCTVMTNVAPANACSCDEAGCGRDSQGDACATR